MFTFENEIEIENKNDSYLILSKNHTGDYRGMSAGQEVDWMRWGWMRLDGEDGEMGMGWGGIAKLLSAQQEPCQRMQKRGKIIFKKVRKLYIQGWKPCVRISFMVEQQAT